jgi:hypothetical protein
MLCVSLTATITKVEKEPNGVVYSIIPIQIEKAVYIGNICQGYAVITVNSDSMVIVSMVCHAVTDSLLMGMYHTMPSSVGGVGLLADRVVLAVPLLGFGFVSWGYAFVCLSLCLLTYIVHIYRYSNNPFCYYLVVFCMDSMDGFGRRFSDTHEY